MARSAWWLPGFAHQRPDPVDGRKLARAASHAAAGEPAGARSGSWRAFERRWRTGKGAADGRKLALAPGDSVTLAGLISDIYVVIA